MKNIYLHGKLKCFCWAVMLAAAVMLFGCPNSTAVKPETNTVAFNVVGNTGGKLTATVDGNNFTGGEVEHGKTVVFTAKPDTGYEVNEWTGAVPDEHNKNSVKLTVDADKTVTVKFKKIESQPPAVSKDKEYTVDGIKFTLKAIPAGNPAQLGYEGAEHNGLHTVKLDAFHIGETEVTQELWLAVMNNNPSFFDKSGAKDFGGELIDTNPADGEEQNKRPVEMVNWYECIAFCNELTKKVPELRAEECVYYSDEGCTLAYTKKDAKIENNVYVKWSKKGFRLPTEAEWEWAAKGGTDYRWAGTDEQMQLMNYAWYNDDDKEKDAGEKTHEVKKKKANGYGLYDMSGNVWEWCWDKYNKNFPDPMPDNYICSDGSRPVYRGGSWNRPALEASRTYRASFNSSKFRYFDTGLRVVCRDNG